MEEGVERGEEKSEKEAVEGDEDIMLSAGVVGRLDVLGFRPAAI